MELGNIEHMQLKRWIPTFQLLSPRYLDTRDAVERTKVAVIPTWQCHESVCQELHITQLLRHQHYSLGEVDKWNTSICTCHAGVFCSGCKAQPYTIPLSLHYATVKGVRGNYIK